MKLLRTKLLPFLTALGALAVILGPIALVIPLGCSSPQSAQSVAIKTAQSVQLTVESALRGWLDYEVRQERALAALPASQTIDERRTLALHEAKVIDALAAYKQAVAASDAGVRASIEAAAAGQTGNFVPATAAMIEAATKFVDLITNLKAH